MKKENNIDSINSLWIKFLDNIESIPTRALLKNHTEPLKITEEEFILLFKREVFINITKGKIPFIASALNQIARNHNEWAKDYHYHCNTNEFHHNSTDNSSSKVIAEIFEF